MTITEKTAYLKGLMEGLKLDTATNEGKLLSAVVETLDEMALSIADLESENEAINEELDLIEDAVDEIDEDIEDMDEDLNDICDILDECYDDDDDEDEEDSEEDDEWDEDDGEEYYQLVCPTCGEEIVVDEDVLAKGEMKCPACGEDLEFDLSDLEDGDEEDEDKE
jgi:hypothetical protein